MKRINQWMLVTTLTCSLVGGMLSGCKSDDDSKEPEPPAAYLSDLLGTWAVEYLESGVADDDQQDGVKGFKYCDIVDVMEFNDDGTGNLYRHFFDDEEQDGIMNHGLVWGEDGNGKFRYTCHADGTIDIELTDNKNPNLPDRFSVFYKDGEVTFQKDTSATRNVVTLSMMKATKELVDMFKDWIDEKQGDKSRLSDATYEVIKDGTLYYPQIVLNVMEGADGDPLAQGIIDGWEKMNPTTRAASMTPTVKYRFFDYKYQSVGYDGKPITLSARIMWGANLLINTHERRPEYMLLCPHYTISNDYTCPTSGRAIEPMFMAGNRLLIMPDYIGFGITKDMPQPYINHDLCAQNSIDAMLAGYNLFCDKANACMEPDWKLYVAGVSQGGGNALAIHKWLDTHDDMAQKFRFAYSYSGAGPYDPGLTFRKYFEQKVHSFPVVFPVVIKAMMASYPELLGKYNEEDFWSASYLTHKAEIDQMVDSKLFGNFKINSKFFEYYPHKGESGVKGGEEILLSDILSDELQDENSQIYKDLFACFEKNNLTKGWTPKHHVYLFHSKGDQIVPYANAEAVVNAFPKDMVTLYPESTGFDSHIASCAQFFLHLFAVE